MTIRVQIERAKRPHRTKCCLNCGMTKERQKHENFCLKHNVWTCGDDVCSYHKYAKKEML
jgi:hypothetical protein